MRSYEELKVELGEWRGLACALFDYRNTELAIADLLELREPSAALLAALDQVEKNAEAKILLCSQRLVDLGQGDLLPLDLQLRVRRPP
jgi:hypothetical protein